MNKTILITNLDQTTLEDHAKIFDAYRQFYKQKSDLIGCKDYLLDRLQNNEIICFGAYIDGALIGIANVYKSFSSVSMCKNWILNDLYIDESARRKGVASILIDAVRAEALKNNIKSLSLQTASDNQSAQKCYEQYGWTRDNFFTYSLSTQKEKA